jgi:hypothetical protein
MAQAAGLGARAEGMVEYTFPTAPASKWFARVYRYGALITH